jgi:hypothetical protein
MERSILHIRAERSWHDDAYLIGNREALMQLRAAIDEALSQGVGFAFVMTSDNERYTTAVFLNDAPAYTDELACQEAPLCRLLPSASALGTAR